MWTQSRSVTDRQTEGRTDGRTNYVTKTVRRIASHGKNSVSNLTASPQTNMAGKKCQNSGAISDDFTSGGATLWQNSANALSVCCHALPVALPAI